MPRVLNIRTNPGLKYLMPDQLGSPSDDGAKPVYIGRVRDEPIRHFGNPFTNLRGIDGTIRVPSRDDAVVAYEDWLTGFAHEDVQPKRMQWILEHIHLLEGRDLVCYCVPLACHGDAIIRYLKWRNETYGASGS
jgi:hypothetical protein